VQRVHTAKRPAKKPPIPTEPLSRRLGRGALGAAALALLIGFVVASLDAAGVSGLGLSYGYLAMAWAVGMGGTYFAEPLWSLSKRKRLGILAGVAVSLGLALTAVGAIEAAQFKDPVPPVMPVPVDSERPPSNNPTKPHEQEISTAKVDGSKTDDLASQAPTPTPLKRLIAYEPPTVGATIYDQGLEPYFAVPVVSLWITNVGDDTIAVKMERLRMSLDGVEILEVKPTTPFILQQTQTMTLQGRPDKYPIPVPPTSKLLKIEIQIEYDTIPETGRRISERTVLYDVNYANGPNSPPLLNSPRVVRQVER